MDACKRLQARFRSLSRGCSVQGLVLFVVVALSKGVRRVRLSWPEHADEAFGARGCKLLSNPVEV